MTGAIYLYGTPIGSINFDDIRIPNTKPGDFLSREKIIAGKLLSAPARKELAGLVRIHLGLPHSTQIRYDLHMISRYRWAATCYTGDDTYLCEVKIRIRL